MLTHKWSYAGSTGPKQWHTLGFPQCLGTKQSPIDLCEKDTEYKDTLQPVRIFLKHGETLEGKEYTLLNNGHSVQIKFPPGLWYLSSRGNNVEEFEVIQMHFHWGQHNGCGSEHTVNGKAYPAEAHLVCFNKIFYEDYKTASTSPLGHVVFGFLMDLEPSNSSTTTFLGCMDDMGQHLHKIIQYEQNVKLKAFDLAPLLEQANLKDYYRYEGSLTTPPCTENVIWTVFKHPVLISEKELNGLRDVKWPPAQGAGPMVDNYRPVLPLNTELSLVPRKLYRSWK